MPRKLFQASWSRGSRKRNSKLGRVCAADDSAMRIFLGQDQTLHHLRRKSAPIQGKQMISRCLWLMNAFFQRLRKVAGSSRYVLVATVARPWSILRNAHALASVATRFQATVP